MKNIISGKDWLDNYENFVSMMWKNDNYSIDVKKEKINKLLNVIANKEDSIDIINAKADLRTCLFLLDIGNDNQLKMVKRR